MMAQNGDRPRCLSVGHITHDRYGEVLSVGGSALYAAKTWQGLGAMTGIATAVGPQFAFKSALRDIAMCRTPSRFTTTFENTYPKDGPRLMLVEHTASDVLSDDLDETWRAPDVMFLAPVIGEVDLKAWTRAVDARIIGIGLQGFLKQKGDLFDPQKGNHALERKAFEPDDALLEKVSAVFLSAEDLEGYADDDLLARLRKSVPFVALTLGEAGARLFLPESTLEVGIRRTDAVDPTGAGDTFAAAALHALARGRSPKDAARLGAAAASIVVEDRGPIALDRVHLAFELAETISAR